MLAGHALQRLHHDLVLVNGYIGLGINRSQLVLCRSHLVVLGLCRHTELPELFIDILHKGCDALTDRTKIVIVQLLPLRRHRTEQCTACEDQILPLHEFLLIYEEILLLRTYGRSHFFRSRIAKQS